MCSTPGSSYRPRQTRHHTVNISGPSSQMMNNASVYYERLQKELAKRRKKQIEDENTRLENAG